MSWAAGTAAAAQGGGTPGGGTLEGGDAAAPAAGQPRRPARPPAGPSIHRCSPSPPPPAHLPGVAQLEVDEADAQAQHAAQRGVQGRRCRCGDGHTGVARARVCGLMAHGSSPNRAALPLPARLETPPPACSPPGARSHVHGQAHPEDAHVAQAAEGEAAAGVGLRARCCRSCACPQVSLRPCGSCPAQPCPPPLPPATHLLRKVRMVSTPVW